MLEVDVETYLAGDLIPKIDIATMAYALEARSPFLDHDLMQLAASIPAELKVRGQEKKWILREALRDWLPGDLLDRPKQGFSVPLVGLAARRPALVGARGPARSRGRWTAATSAARRSRICSTATRRASTTTTSASGRCSCSSSGTASTSTSPAPGCVMPPEVETVETVEGERVERTARRALWWSIANNLVGRVGTTLMGIVLARLLVPEDYGIYAAALVALSALLSMNELGVSLAIVRRPGDVSRIAPTVKTLALGFSCLLWVLMFAAAPHVAAAVGSPEAANVLRVLTLSVLIDAMTAVPAALMTRDFMQKERLIVDTAGFIVGSITAIGLALAGFGVWALVWSALLGNVVNAAFILHYSPDRHPFGFRRDVARELLAFGLPLALASLVIMGLLNIDYVVIGAQLGAVQLGFYLLAFNLASWPVNMFSAPARRVSLPLFARLHAGETDASEAFVPVCTLLLLVTLPACLVLAALARPIVQIVYGDTWLPAASVLPWLMVLALVRVIGELVYDFLVALGSSRSNLSLQVVWLTALAIALPIAARRGGIEAVAMAHAGVAVGIVVPTYAIVLHRAGVSLRAVASQVLRPLVATVAGGVVAVGVALLIPDAFARLTLGAALIGLVYLVIVFPMRRLLKSPALGAA